MSLARSMIAIGVSTALLTLTTAARADEPVESDPSTGWSLGAAIGGLALGAVTLSLGLVSMTTFDGENEDGVDEYGALGPAMAAGAAAVTAISGPIVWLGSRSARQTSPEVTGVPALRGVGWVFYGVQILFLSAVTGVAASGERVDGWLSAVGGALGLVSLNGFAIDAMVAWHQARNLPVTSADAPSTDTEAPAVESASAAPSFTAAPIVAPRAGGGLVLGVAAVF